MQLNGVTRQGVDWEKVLLFGDDESSERLDVRPGDHVPNAYR
jgi:hypothetical protein